MKAGLILLLLASFLFSCGRNPPKQTTTFPQDLFLSRRAESEGKQFRFRVFVPIDKKPGERLPVMLYLHGSDERSEDNESQLSGPGPMITSNPSNFPFIIVFPQCPAERFWDNEMIQRAMIALDRTVEEFNADETRLYLAGFSLGGYGVWTTAAMFPGKFAAIIPMSGRVLPRASERKSVSEDILNLADAADPYAAYASKLRDTPTWIFHGANDNIVPVESSRRMAKALKDAGNNTVRYSELENTGHVSLTAAFNDPDLFEWIGRQQIVEQ